MYITFDICIATLCNVYSQDPVEIISQISSFLELQRSAQFIQGVADLTCFGEMTKFDGKVQNEKTERYKKLFRKGEMNMCCNI